MAATGISIISPDQSWPSEWFEHIGACLLCGSADCAPLLDGVQDWFFGAVPGAFGFARCRDCGSLLLERRPDAAHIGLAYAKYYTHAGAQAPAPPSGLVRRIGHDLAQGYARRRYGGGRGALDAVRAGLFALFPVRRGEVDATHRHLPPAPAEVLDYGCGNGAFLARAAGFGHLVSGVEFDAAAAAVARQGGVAVYDPVSLPEAAFAGRFDLITAVHVIEHVADPVALLGDFRRWLKPGGRVFLEMPNAEAGGLARHGRFWRGLEAPRHFSLPSVRGLAIAIERAGFEPVRIGRRAFARQFMDAASAEAAAAHPHISSGAGNIRHADGPEIITFLASLR